MSTSAVEVHPLAQNVECADDSLIVWLVDGRTISVPISWLPTLSNASISHRANWELLGDGEGIHWPDP